MAAIDNRGHVIFRDSDEHTPVSPMSGFERLMREIRCYLEFVAIVRQ
jgi:hypothetical protein